MTWLTYWHWFTFALVLVIAESLGAAGFLIALGMAAASIGVLMLLFSMSWQVQLVLFSVLSILFAFAWWHILRLRQDKPLSTLNRPMEAMVGLTTVLIEPIIQGQGKIKVNDATWFVTGSDAKKGSTVRIIGVNQQNNSLIVELME